MRFALAQINPTTGDVSGNTDIILNEIRQAKENSADLAIFPEMAVTGYNISDLIESRKFIDANLAAVRKIAENTDGIAAVVGFVDCDAGRKNEDGTLRKYNAAAVLSDGKIAGIAHKTSLPSYRYFDDKRYFSPGEYRTPIAVELAGRPVRLGVSICEDMWDSNYAIKPVEELAVNGADLLISINASPFVPGKRDEREKIIREHIKKTGKPFIYVNTSGAADNGKNIIPFEGQSMFYDSCGNLTGCGNQFDEETSYIDFDIDKGAGVPIGHPVFCWEKETFGALSMGLRDYARKTGFERAIVPVSGGIDSSLGLAITVDAFGKENVTAYNLPSEFNSETTRDIAERLAANFGVEYRVIPIQEIDSTIKNVFESNNHAIEQGVSKENLHARIRGVLMMLESNDAGALLISNGNKTEIALGYATLYGDMCGGVSVIGDVDKIGVYRIARYVNKRAGKELIPGRAFTIKPSAELCAGQYDPFDYFVVSPIVNEFIESRKDPEEIMSLYDKRALDPGKFLPDSDGKTVYDKLPKNAFENLVYDIYDSFRKSVYKRQQGPPIIAVTERAFGYDLRETIINGWRGK